MNELNTTGRTPAELRAMADALEYACPRSGRMVIGSYAQAMADRCRKLAAELEAEESAAQEMRRVSLESLGVQACRQEDRQMLATPAGAEMVCCAARAMVETEPFPRERRVQRIEDMSPRGYLELYIEEDGDIIVTSCGMDHGLVEPGSSVQFCVAGSGGGRSSRTRRALLDLMVAMEKDNEEHPIRHLEPDHSPADSEGGVAQADTTTASQEAPAAEREGAGSDQKPVAHFLFDGQTWHQASDEYANDADVIPLYLAPPELAAAVLAERIRVAQECEKLVNAPVVYVGTNASGGSGGAAHNLCKSFSERIRAAFPEAFK